MSEIDSIRIVAEHPICAGIFANSNMPKAHGSINSARAKSNFSARNSSINLLSVICSAIKYIDFNSKEYYLVEQF
jgi:hypothetical protein